MSKSQSFIKAAALIFGLVLLLLLVYFNSYRTRSPVPDQALCSPCHSMTANLMTWQVTAHNKVGCSKCHNDVSLTNVLVKELTNGYETPIKKIDPILDTNCIKCHNQDRKVTGPGDLIIPHKLHMEKQINCTRCHDNVTHGKVGQEILLTKGKDPKDLTKEEAAELTAIGNRIPMRVCMECHNGKKASDSCTACHSNKAVPSSHTQEFTLFAHGDQALKDFTSCVKCHEYDVKKQARYDSTKKDFKHLRENVRNNNFCQACHSKRPITHDPDFIVSHPKNVKTENTCLVCHNRQPKEFKLEAAKEVYCNTCHNNESVHPTNWLTQHPVDLAGKNTNECFSCHNANSCSSCHDERGIKR